MKDFDTKFYMSMLRTTKQMGVEILPLWKCAKIFAICQVFGNNEGFTLSAKFNCDREFIQETYGLRGGETPDAEFVETYKEYVGKYEKVTSMEDVVFKDAAKFMDDMYKIKLYV